MNQNIRVINTLEEMIAAFKEAAQEGELLVVSSPEGAMGFAGAQYYEAMFNHAQSLYPEARVKFILDCACYPGWAMRALRQGMRSIRFKGTPEVTEKIRSLAETYEAEIVINL